MANVNGLYAIQITMVDGARGRASGVIVLRDGRLSGGDSYFFYTGSYEARANGSWRGELLTRQHTAMEAIRPVFGGRDVSAGFSGTYADGQAEVSGTALVGTLSVGFRATLRLLEPL